MLSLSTAEYVVRNTVSAISSAMEKMAFLNSSSAIGSVAAIWSSMEGSAGNATGKPTLRAVALGMSIYGLHPHSGIVEGSAAVRGDGIVADQRVNGPLFLEGGRRPNALDDERRLVLARVERGFQNDRAAAVADAHTRTRADAQLKRRMWMHAQHRPALLGNRGRRLREGRVEEIARRRANQFVGMLRIALLVVLQPICDGGHARVGRPDPLPIRLEVELAVGLGEAVEEMRALEGQRAVNPAN